MLGLIGGRLQDLFQTLLQAPPEQVGAFAIGVLLCGVGTAIFALALSRAPRRTTALGRARRRALRPIYASVIALASFGGGALLVARMTPDGLTVVSTFGTLLQGAFSVLAFWGLVLGFNYQSRQIELQHEQLGLQTMQLRQANIISLHQQFEESWRRIGTKLALHIGVADDAMEEDRPFSRLLENDADEKLQAAMSGAERDAIAFDLINRFILKFESFRSALSTIEDSDLLEGALLDAKDEKTFYVRFKRRVAS